MTNDSSNANVSLRVEGKVDADVLITPEVLQLGSLKPGQEARFPVIVRSKKAVRIERIVCASHPDSVQVIIPSDEKATHVLSVVVMPPDVMGEFEESFTVTIAGRSQPLVFKARGLVESLTTAQDTTK